MATAIVATTPIIPAAMYIVVGGFSGAGDGDTVGRGEAVGEGDGEYVGVGVGEYVSLLTYIFILFSLEVTV